MNFTFESKSINYIQKGQGDLLIILPGNSVSSKAYTSQLEFLSNYFLTVSLDYLGTGKSDRFYDMNENWWRFSAKQVSALISHLGYQKAKVVGSSGGAVVAMFLAADFPEKISNLILDSFSLRFTKKMFSRNVVKEREKPNDNLKQFWFYCHGSDWKSVIKQDTENIRKIVSKGGDWLADTPNKIRCPTLLLGSKQDRFIPDIEQDYKQLTEQINDSRYILSEDGDHPLIWTNHGFFNKNLLKLCYQNEK